MGVAVGWMMTIQGGIWLGQDCESLRVGWGQGLIVHDLILCGDDGCVEGTVRNVRLAAKFRQQ